MLPSSPLGGLMGRRISIATRQELVTALGARYGAASRGEKSRILDEFVATTGYHRKHAVRVLWDGLAWPRAQGAEPKTGSAASYLGRNTRHGPKTNPAPGVGWVADRRDSRLAASPCCSLPAVAHSSPRGRFATAEARALSSQVPFVGWHH